MAVDKNWYWTVSSQKEVTKLLDWLKAQGERIDNSFDHTDTWCYISYDVLRGEWHLVKSCDVLYSNKSFQSLLPWESEESKLIAGKWYKDNRILDCFFKFSGNIESNKLIAIEVIYHKKHYPKQSCWYFTNINVIEEASPEEYLQYLPDGHPDKIGDKKIEELTEFPLSGFCKTKSSELKAYLENKFPAQKKTSKWDDNYKLIAWNYTAYWLCKEKSNRPEYTIEQLQKFFNKKSITEKLLEEAKLKYPTSNFSKQIDKTPEFLMLDSEVVEFQALPKRKPVSIQLIGID